MTSYLEALPTVVVFQKAVWPWLVLVMRVEQPQEPVVTFLFEGVRAGGTLDLITSVYTMNFKWKDTWFVSPCLWARVCVRGLFHVEWAPEDAYMRASVGGRTTRKAPPRPPTTCEPCCVDKGLFVFVKGSLERLGERLQASVKSVSFYQQLVDILIKLSVQIKRIKPCFRSDWTSSSTRKKKKRRSRRLEHDLIESFQECQFFSLSSVSKHWALKSHLMFPGISVQLWNLMRPLQLRSTIILNLSLLLLPFGCAMQFKFIPPSSSHPNKLL